MKRVMLDIETMGTASNAVICSVGVAVFDRHEILESFGMQLDWDAQVKSGRTIDTSTLQWWLKQSDSARAALLDKKDTVSVEDMHSIMAETCSRASQIWAKGPDFDPRLLSDIFRQHDLFIPWKFWHVRDVRTMEDVAKKLGIQYVTNTAHTAEADAVNQANMVLAVEKRIYT